MSASREKKNRQNPEFQGAQDAKAMKAAKEQAKQRRSGILYIIIAVAFVLVGAFSVLKNAGIFERSAAAMEIDGKKYTAAEVSYYYHNAVNTVRNSSYASYFSLDTSTAYDQQNLNDTDKMLLSVTDESVVTWEDYFRSTAKTNMINTYAMEKAANEAGFTFDEDMQAQLDSTMDSLNTYASSNGYSAKAYVKMIYGKAMTLSTFKDLIRTDILVDSFGTYYANNLTYTDADLEAYYESDTECFDQADYEYLYISGTAAPTTDADGNTVEATEEDVAAAAEAAKACLADVQARVANGESMEAIAAEYDNSTLISYKHVSNATTDGSDVANWAFDADRTEGDITTIDTTVEGGTPTYYVALFHSAGRPEYNVVNVRHILIAPDSNNEDTDAAKADAKAKAEELLQQWSDGEATEASFAALATANTTDSGSASNGGLYENILKGQMVAAFNDWCFDAGRQTGDTGIVETSYGYHVMYFVSTGDAAWKVQARDELKSADLQEYALSLTEGLEAVELSGMKYVG